MGSYAIILKRSYRTSKGNIPNFFSAYSKCSGFNIIGLNSFHENKKKKSEKSKSEAGNSESSQIGGALLYITYYTWACGVNDGKGLGDAEDWIQEMF